MVKKSRNIYLLKNTAIFAIGNIGTRLINFLMVPLYTYTLTTSDYGIINTYGSICAIILPLIMCNIGEAIRRYLLDNHADVYGIRTVEFVWLVLGTCMSTLACAVLYIIPFTHEYAILIGLYIFTNACAIVTLEYLRGMEQLKLYTFCGLFQTFLIALLNIIFLIKLRKGVEGYYTSYVLSYAISTVIAFFGGKQYKNLRNLHFDKRLFTDMSKFSLTLVPNSLMWWVANGSDKLMLTYFVSSAATGIYAVSAKLPTILSTMNTILLQAWQHSAIKESDSSDKVEYNNKMFQFYTATTSIVGAGLLLINRPFMNIYVAPEYRMAWMYSPFLIVSAMLTTLSTFVGTSYYVEKDMRGNLKSATVGAITNVALNAFMIPLFGITGAAMATCVSYILVLAFRVVDTRKYIPIRVVTPFTIKLGTIILLMLTVSFIEGVVAYILLIIGMILVLIITKEYYLRFVKSAINKVSKKR